MRHPFAALSVMLSLACGASVASTSQTRLQACVAPADCTGALPALCQVCDDGRMACAHFECTNGACEVQVCPPRQACVIASDCTGPLPLVPCAMCTSGLSEVVCPHWECREQVCFADLYETCP